MQSNGWRVIKNIRFNSNVRALEQYTENKRKLAVELLDCMTSPTDSNQIDYDHEKDVRREKLLLNNDILVSSYCMFVSIIIRNRVLKHNYPNKV